METENVDKSDVQQIEDMLQTNLELENKYTSTDEYKELYAKAKEVYPDMPPFLIQVALLSYLEDK